MDCRKPIFPSEFTSQVVSERAGGRCVNSLALWSTSKPLVRGVFALSMDSGCSLHPQGQARSGLWWGETDI